MIAVRVLGARVVGGDHGEVGELRARPAHQRALLAVAVAAGAEHPDHAATGRAGGPAPSTFSSESGVCA